MAHVRFGGCYVLKNRLRCSFALARPYPDKGFVQIKEEVPGWWAHRFDLATPADLRLLDSWLARRIHESWREFGMRGRLAKKTAR